MTEIFDLDAVIAERDEAPFTFRFGGDTFTLPAHFSLDSIERMDAGELAGTLEDLLGPDQWARLVDLEAVLDVHAFSSLIEAYCAHLGIDLGKSQPSADSSNRAARRSKRTSSGTTKSR